MFAKKSTYGQNRRNFRKISIFEDAPKSGGVHYFVTFLLLLLNFFQKYSKLEQKEIHS